jgi:hypothetical protein
MEKNMGVQDDSHAAEIKRIFKEQRKETDVCEDLLDRCEKDLTKEKRDGEKALKDL